MASIRSKSGLVGVCCALSVLVSTRAKDAHAQVADGVAVQAIVETGEAVYFQPTINPSVVWYVSRSETRLAPIEGPAGSNFWRASVELESLNTDPAEIDPAWAGATLVPYVLRPQEECVLERRTGMRFVQQEVRAQGRDVSAGGAPVCQFSFRLPLSPSPELLQELEEAAAANTLIRYALPLVLRQESSVAWEVVHAAVSDVLGDASEDQLSQVDAESALDAALAGEQLEAVQNAMTAEERAQFLEASLERLFSGAPGKLHLSTNAPFGSIVYHVAVTSYSL